MIIQIGPGGSIRNESGKPFNPMVWSLSRPIKLEAGETIDIECGIHLVGPLFIGSVPDR